MYHIGLPIISGTELECVVRLSSLEHKFLDLQELITAFQNDPSLAAVEQPSVMQMLYICIGCDFFTGFGKATFMATSFEYSDFICSTTAHTPGTLSAFSRLVGCAYFRKHKAVFLPSFPTPATLFNSLLKDGQDAKSHHSAWLALIERK